MPTIVLTTATRTVQQATAKLNAIPKARRQSNRVKTAAKQPANTEPSGGKRKRAAPEKGEVQARPKKGNKVQAEGAEHGVEVVGTLQVGPGGQRRVTRARNGLASKTAAQTDGRVVDNDHKSSDEGSLQAVINANPRRDGPTKVSDAYSRGVPASATAKGNQLAAKRRRTVIEEDPFETNEEDNVSTAESNKKGEDATSGDEEENRSDSEDGLGGANIGAILTAERPAWNDKATSATGKGKAVDKKAPARPKHVPRAPAVNTHRLMLDAMDISSGSEFELDDDMEAADEDVDDEEEEERQAWAEFVAARAARAQNKTLPRPPTARERVERPVWKNNNTNVDAGPSTSLLLPSSTAPSVPVGPVFGTTAVLTSAPTNQAQSYDEDDEDEEAENAFGPDDDVIGGLIIDPTAPAPIPQPIPPIVVPLLAPLLTPAIHVPAAQPLQVAPPQPIIPDVIPPQGYTIVPNATGGAPQLNPQHIHVIRTIRAAIPLLELYLATELAFPDSFVASQFITTILVTSAANLGLTGLVARCHAPNWIGTWTGLCKPCEPPSTRGIADKHRWEK
ncbi:hypothetical protein LXA43DRAFT_1101574 [Ganoderma leucocontextum]|nr:hypothetical protein LXA43DRAFT_1101574 [Ganoderma leucocontextum]